MAKLRPNFEEANSSNLPEVDSEMIDLFYSTNIDFISHGVKNVKAQKSARESYTDEAIGFVQLKREGDVCILYGIVTPEHKVRQSGYNVCLMVNENEKRVIDCKCIDCPASEGGCKHGIALLFWLFRQSLKPAPTSVECYWKKPTLAKVGTTLKAEFATDIFKTASPSFECEDNTFLDEVVNVGKKLKLEGVLFDFFDTNLSSITYKLSVYHLHVRFMQNGVGVYNAQSFLDFCKINMNILTCEEAKIATKTQTKDKLWYELRFGRITASKLHEVANCHTVDGTTTQTVLGASKIIATKAMLRGINLEKKVLQVVAKQRKIDIESIGLCLNPNYPVFGASPDGVSKEFVIEVKCPIKESTIEQYIKNGKVMPKPFAQIQLQMFFTNKRKGLVCVASPRFEKDEEVFTTEVPFDAEFCKKTMDKALDFWKKAIFPCLKK